MTGEAPEMHSDSRAGIGQGFAGRRDEVGFVQEERVVSLFRSRFVLQSFRTVEIEKLTINGKQ